MSYLDNANLHAKNQIQLRSWTSVLDSYLVIKSILAESNCYYSQFIRFRLLLISSSWSSLSSSSSLWKNFFSSRDIVHVTFVVRNLKILHHHHISLVNQRIPSLSETRRLPTMFTRARHWTMYWITWSSPHLKIIFRQFVFQRLSNAFLGFTDIFSRILSLLLCPYLSNCLSKTLTWKETNMYICKFISRYFSE
jgi:hypothetical protein